MEQKRHTKVIKLQILKPTNMSWNELGQLLNDVRYRVFRLANMAISEMYLAFHGRRTSQDVQKITVGRLNKNLRTLLDEEAKRKKNQTTEFNHFSKEGALAATITDALSQYKLRAISSRSKWSEIARGKSALPTFRLNMAIPVRCDKPDQSRLEGAPNGDVEVNLLICLRPYPRVLLSTNSLSDGHREILNNLLENKDNSETGYQQRCLEIKRDERTKKWFLFVTYSFPAKPAPTLSKEIIVGTDLGVSCPLYAALSSGYARLGRRNFTALASRIRTLQNRTIVMRRNIQRGGKTNLSGQTARDGHGRNRKLLAIKKFKSRIDNAYTTLNHQLSRALIRFALDQGAGIIQMENLEGMAEELTGTFLGERWRYEQLQRFIKYKAEEIGIDVRQVNPKYTSRRCSNCGHIEIDFSRTYRDKNRTKGNTTEFLCSQCGFKSDPDYNAARNLATLDIEKQIQLSLDKLQGNKEVL